MLFEFLWFMLMIVSICILLPGPGSCGCISLFGGQRNTEAILGASRVVIFLLLGYLPIIWAP